MKVQQPVVHCLVLVRNTSKVFPAIHIPRADTHADIGPRGVFKMAVTQLTEYHGRGCGDCIQKDLFPSYFERHCESKASLIIFTMKISFHS